jgi:hypothetical protein
MVLLGLIVTAGFGALRLTGRSWEAGVARSEHTDEQTAGPAYLGHQVAQMVAPLWRVQGEVRLPFEGGPERMRFLAPAPAADGEAGIYQVMVARITEHPGARLVLHLDRFDPTHQAFREPSTTDPVVLLAGLKDVRLAYHDLAAAATRDDWVEQWPADAQHLPSLVRVRVTPAEDGASAYDLVYPVRVDAARPATMGPRDP